MKLVIIAGGKGTRLGLKDIPKSMVQIGWVPILEHQINNAKRYGIKSIYILSGYLQDIIQDYFGDGSAFGVSITYIAEKYPLGTAGAVKQLEGILNERFMVFYGDVIFDLDLKSFMEFDKAAPSIATIIIHPNDHPYDSDLLDINEENIVTDFHPKPHNENAFYRNLVNAAVYILDPSVFKYIPQDKPSDFGKDIFPLLVDATEKICAYSTAEYIKDVGTPERFKKTCDDYQSGRIERCSKRHKRPAIFIDRDGTLIKDMYLLCRPEDLELFPFSADAIRKINASDYLCFLITNQPVVARNLCDIPTVNQIHNKLETLLGRGNAYLNGIFFCPHHPDKGYPEENPVYKIKCDCRKPSPGMIYRAATEYNINLGSSWMIGNTTIDVQTGKNAGLKTVLVRTGKGGRDMKFDVTPGFVFDNLKDAVEYIITEG